MKNSHLLYCAVDVGAQFGADRGVLVRVVQALPANLIRCPADVLQSGRVDGRERMGHSVGPSRIVDISVFLLCGHR